MIPLRILHVLDTGSSATVRAGPSSLLPWLASQGHAVAHLALGGGAEGVFPQRLGLRLGWWNWWRRGRAEAIRSAAAWGCDLVHAHGEAALAPALEVA
ncbi:MAG: hypothetical protein J0M02_11750, partial [Planctomycetes bacterium]|nr:hypothetical protein [Planctomycetota bacterium]